MLDLLSEKLFKAINLVPALFVAEDSPAFWIARGAFAILLIVLIILAVAGVQQLMARPDAHKR